jgi:hypothetical protein
LNNLAGGLMDTNAPASDILHTATSMADAHGFNIDDDILASQFEFYYEYQ